MLLALPNLKARLAVGNVLAYGDDDAVTHVKVSAMVMLRALKFQVTPAPLAPGGTVADAKYTESAVPADGNTLVDVITGCAIAAQVAAANNTNRVIVFFIKIIFEKRMKLSGAKLRPAKARGNYTFVGFFSSSILSFRKDFVHGIHPRIHLQLFVNVVDVLADGFYIDK